MKSWLGDEELAQRVASTEPCSSGLEAAALHEAVLQAGVGHGVFQSSDSTGAEEHEELVEQEDHPHVLLKHKKHHNDEHSITLRELHHNKHMLLDPYDSGAEPQPFRKNPLEP